MNSTAVLSCFKAGASMKDLAEALGVERGLVEQMVREALDFGGRPPAGPLPATPRPAPRTSPTDAGRPTTGNRAAQARRMRRSSEQIQAALLDVLEQHGPQLIGALHSATASSRSVTLRQLRILQRAGRVRRAGRTWVLNVHKPRSSAA